MNKVIVLIIFTLIPLTGHCDIYYLPVRYTGFFISADLLYGIEKIKNANNTLGVWAGISMEEPVYNSHHPVGITGFAIEGKQYLEPEHYDHFFVSGYLSVVFVTDLNNVANLGLNPGLRFGYKSLISDRLILEPYLDLSLPLIYDMDHQNTSLPFSALTIGVRIRFSKIISRQRSRE